MTWPDKDSPLWGILRVSIRSGVLLVALYLFYDRMDARDIKTVVLCLCADSGVTGAAALIRGAK